MLDLNDLRVFERVGSLRSFAGASRALALPRSSVSRSIARLENRLGTRLIHRTTRDVALTPAGVSLLARCMGPLDELGQALDYVGSLATEAQGELRVSVGIGFGIAVIAPQLSAFLRRYPRVDLLLDLTSRNAELVAERVDVAIRLGPLPDSSLVAVRLGQMNRFLCASRDYLGRCGPPRALEDLASHDAIDIPGPGGQVRIWSFSREGETFDVVVRSRVLVNDGLTLNRLVLDGAGIGIISGFLCAPDIKSGRLVHLMPEWIAPAVDVHLIFPSKRELAPAVRAFVNFMKEADLPALHRQHMETFAEVYS